MSSHALTFSRNIDICLWDTGLDIWWGCIELRLRWSAGGRGHFKGWSGRYLQSVILGIAYIGIGGRPVCFHLLEKNVRSEFS